MIVVASVLATVIFVVSFKLSGIYPIVLDALNSAHEATNVISNSSLDDDEKERLVKKAAIHLLKLFVQITIFGAVILSMPILFLLALDRLAIIPFQDVIDFLLKWEVILAMTLCIIVMKMLRR